MIWLVLTGVLLVAIMAPGLWVKHVLKKYREPADRYRSQGTGAELARHLLDRFELTEVRVESTDDGDHYDPTDRTVRLADEQYAGYSLTAVTVAAHEVGHALQHARGEGLFAFRQQLVSAAVVGERAGQMLMLAAPLALAFAGSPQLSFVLVLLALASMALGTLVHLVTLPVELDASYGKALPILEQGEYLQEGDLPHARRILKAAALTYVAGSLASLLNLGRWIAILRR